MADIDELIAQARKKLAEVKTQADNTRQEKEREQHRQELETFRQILEQKLSPEFLQVVGLKYEWNFGQPVARFTVSNNDAVILKLTHESEAFTVGMISGGGYQGFGHAQLTDPLFEAKVLDLIGRVQSYKAPVPG